MNVSRRNAQKLGHRLVHERDRIRLIKPHIAVKRSHKKHRRADTEKSRVGPRSPASHLTTPFPGGQTIGQAAALVCGQRAGKECLRR